MARLCAQLFTLIFAVAGIGGMFLGDASSAPHGVPGGNLGPLTLELTWGRDVLDIALGILFGYVGFFAGRHAGRLLVLGAGIVLLLLAAVGFIRPGGTAALHFPTAVNVFDLVTGLLAVLCALGTVEDPAPVRSIRDTAG